MPCKRPLLLESVCQAKPPLNLYLMSLEFNVCRGLIPLILAKLRDRESCMVMARLYRGQKTLAA